MIDSLKLATRRLGWRDIALALLFVRRQRGVHPSATCENDAYQPSTAAVVFFPLIFVPLAWRRVAPLAAVGGTLAALIAHVAVFGEMIRCGILIPLDDGARLLGRRTAVGPHER